MVKPNDDMTCPPGTGLVTRIVKRKPQVFCRVGASGLSSEYCSDRALRSFTITGSDELDKKIIEGIEKEFDLCFQPTGAYFCRANLGIPRVDMPQFRGDVLDRSSDIRQFLDELLDMGIKIEERFVPVCQLKSTQNQLEGAKIRGMIETIQRANGNLTDPTVRPLVQPIIVSKDYYVLDGHHRWASLLAWDFMNGKDTVRMHVRVIDRTMDELYELSIKSSKATFDKSYKGKV